MAPVATTSTRQTRAGTPPPRKSTNNVDENSELNVAVAEEAKEQIDAQKTPKKMQAVGRFAIVKSIVACWCNYIILSGIVAAYCLISFALSSFPTSGLERVVHALTTVRELVPTAVHYRSCMSILTALGRSLPAMKCLQVFYHSDVNRDAAFTVATVSVCLMVFFSYRHIVRKWRHIVQVRKDE